MQASFSSAERLSQQVIQEGFRVSEGGPVLGTTLACTAGEALGAVGGAASRKGEGRGSRQHT